MRCRCAVLAVLSALLGTAPAFGQVGTTIATKALHDTTVAVRLKDGSLLVGLLVDRTADSVRIVTSGGRMTLNASEVTEIKVIDAADLHNGTYWAPDPHDSRLFFGPTGRTLAKGSGYFSDLYLFLVNGAVGVTDRLTLGAGMSFVPSSDFLNNNVYYVTPKVGLVRSETFNVAAGALIGVVPGSNTRTSSRAGIYYLVATSGRPDASLTYGLGYSYFDSSVSGDATLMLGGNVRVARHVSLMTENYVFTGPGGGYWAPIYGVRFIGDHLSADLGLLNFVGRNTVPFSPGLPWLGFAIKF
jgi:hypothetical protein